MRVIKKINNNAAICIDEQNKELVALGKGIGFSDVPYELTDLSSVQRTFYNVNVIYYDLLNLIPEDILNVSIKIVDRFKSRLDIPVSPNLVFTLADHLNYAVERVKKNIQLEAPFILDIKQIYEKEYEMSVLAVKMVNKELHIHLPKSEAGNIAMHFINSETEYQADQNYGYIGRVINDIYDIICKHFDIHIDKDTFSYSRFVSHLIYLLKRGETGIQVSSMNAKLFDDVVGRYKGTYQCVEKISDYLQEEFNLELNKEEKLYLMLHVNRLCAREDCYRKSITSAK